MNKSMLACLVTLTVLAAGCGPYNHYEVTMTPHGGVIERKLLFYRWNPGSFPGDKGPGYIHFDSDELKAIAALYPKTGLTSDGDQHTVRAEFTCALPGDIGGTGWYVNLSTSLGDAGFYVERSRGSDDLVAVQEKKLQAADQLTDLVIGWSKTQFKSEPGFKKLHQFLDRDFRHDLKNLSLYLWRGGGFNFGEPNKELNEVLGRFLQYLIERGYVKIEELPRLIPEWGADDDAAAYLLLQRLIAEKLGITAEQPMPQSLAFMADLEAVENSWTNYLAGTKSYRAKLRSFKKANKTNTLLRKPDPSDMTEDLFNTLIETGSVGGPDRFIVRLVLSSEPLTTNGKWDETLKQVIWESGLAQKDHISSWPVFCYANWVVPREDFQKDHLGSVSLIGEDLLNYCFWRLRLEKKNAVEWEQFLTNFKPGADAKEKLNNFRFAGEPEQIAPGEPKRNSDIGKELVKAALESRR
jgi:hypothetical protein